ncbi:hypothetical protein A2U01_0103053, partial [Trifolium medium]|nr:hypothetical protein [Trifolium medium]
APLGGVHQEETLHLLDTTGDILQSRRNATKDLCREESWISHCPQDWRNRLHWISTKVRPIPSTT